MYMEASQCIFRDTRAQGRRGQYDLTRMARTIRLEHCAIFARTSFPSVIPSRDFPSRATGGSFDSPLVIASDPRLPAHFHHNSLRQYFEQYAQRREPLLSLSI